MSKFGISNVLNQSNRDGRISTKPNSKGEFTNYVNISTSERYDVSLSADQQANVSRWVFIKGPNEQFNDNLKTHFDLEDSGYPGLVVESLARDCRSDSEFGDEQGCRDPQPRRG